MSETASDPNRCVTVEELTQPRSRAILSRAARDYLDTSRVTPIELLFWAPHGRKFHGAGTALAACIQKVAIAQVQVTGRPVAERVKELFALGEKVMSWSDGLAKSLPEGGLNSEMLSSIVSALHQDGPNRAVAALARHVEGATNWIDKVLLCCDLVDDKIQPKALKIIDDLLAEVFDSEAAVTAITGHGDLVEKRIQVLVALAGREAECRSGLTLSPELLRISHVVSSGRLVETRAACRRRIAAALTGPGRLASTHAMEEFRALAGCVSLLQKAVSLGGLDVFAETIEKRMARIVTGDNFGAFLEGTQGFGQRLLRLIWILDRTMGPHARQELLKFIEYQAKHRDLEVQFAPPATTASDRQLLAEQVLKSLLSSQMGDSRREALLGILKPVLQRLSGADRRVAVRRVTGPDDHVIVNNMRLPLKNWSTSGLLFGPMSSPPALGSKLVVTVHVVARGSRIRFEAEAEVLRIVNGEVGARYTCRDAAALGQIQAYFSG